MLFSDCLCFQVNRVARKMTRIIQEVLTPYRLTTTQFFLLTALYEEDGILISALAQKVALDRATLTGLLDRMDRDDLIERRPDAEDRRAIRIHLTQKAEELRKELTDLYHRNNSSFLSLLTQEEKNLFETAIAKLEPADFKEI
ncbi:MAG: MarR family transcriptional regulator [Thermodesulfobacteriota bacterium]|nr:MarR family transcriptional regulator [Thermodesulfobacteriota bacterium]